MPVPSEPEWSFMRMEDPDAGARSQAGFQGTNSPYLIFGLDQAKHVDKVAIRWPNGAMQTLPALAVNQAIIVTEGAMPRRITKRQLCLPGVIGHIVALCASVVSCTPVPKAPAESALEQLSVPPEHDVKSGPRPLAIDPSITPQSGPLPDRSKSLKTRIPWDNYTPYEPLTTSFTNPLAERYRAFQADFIGTLMRTGAVDFQLIHHFYTDGFLSRDKRAHHLRNSRLD